MVTYNPTCSKDEIVIDHALTNRKGVLIKKALNSGHDCEGGVEKSFEFSLNHPGVTSIIFGTISSAHLEANVQTAIKVLA